MKTALRLAFLPPLMILASCGTGSKTENGAASAASSVKSVPAPAGTSWTETVKETPDGGYLLGNPDAPVKLVEYGSFTCRHCADFAKTSEEELKSDFIATGKVSYEFRSYIRDPFDIAASLIVQCAGKEAYFSLASQMFAGQHDWMGLLQKIPQTQMETLYKLPIEQQMPAMAKAANFDEFARQRGIPAAKANQCLADRKVIDMLDASRNRANTEYDLQATPTFLLNGQVLSNTASWDQVKAALKGAGA